MDIKLMQLKEELKEMAVKIRKERMEAKERQRETGINRYGWRSLSYIYRHKHIAYCLLRGGIMKQIESKNREHNEPNMSEVNMYMEQYREEVICVDQK